MSEHGSERHGISAADTVRRLQDSWVDLYWLPLGVGDASHCVRWNGLIFESVMARVEHRRRSDLYHSALRVRVDGYQYVIEMAPVWGNKEPDRGVVCAGSVGLTWLGRSKFFRYEVRRWRNGVIPDLSQAVASPRRVSAETPSAAAA
jgi:hypothetical protein